MSYAAFSYAAPPKLLCILLSNAAPYRATLHSLSYAAPYLAKLPPSKLRCTLLSYPALF